jgi:hypothetical protein
MTKQADKTNGSALNPTIEAGVVNALQHDCHQNATNHGFKRDWEDAAFLEKLAEKMSGYQMWEITGEVDEKDTSSVEVYLIEIAARYRNNILGNKLMLIVSELSEGLESLRNNGGAEGALDGQGNFGEELADAIIRIFDTGGYTKDNLGDELLRKMETNSGREHMHGKVM